jgi:hypothetical protein
MGIQRYLCVALAGSIAAGCDGGGNSGAADAAIDSRPADAAIPTEKFSFFVTSLKRMRELSGNSLGFGGDLRFGETGPGAGLRGADKICSTIAGMSMPNANLKTWRAFLSARDGGNGQQVNAIDRIGNGPWYDRLGRLLAPSKADLMFIRPQNGDVTIRNDFPNEDGVPNHDPDGTGQVDNHDFLTGTNSQGQLYSATATCLDWTAKSGNKPVEGQPRVGHSWPRGGGGQIDSWMNSLTESGCAPSVDLVEMGPPNPNHNTVGSGGGYGGIYCFALQP